MSYCEDCLPREATPATPWAAREHALSDGRAVVVRLFDVFGGDLNCGAAPAGAAASLVRALARGLPGGAATYEGDASHVSEAATWLCAALDAAETGDRFVAVNGGRGATVRGPELEAAAAVRGAPPSSPPSASRCADVSKLRELLGVTGGGLSLSLSVGLCSVEDGSQGACVSPVRPPSLPRALLRARRRARRGLAVADRLPTQSAVFSGRAILPALPADALTAVLAFVDGADLARLRSATKGLIAGADAAAVALCRAKGYSRPDWAAPGAPRLLAAAGAWRHPVTVSRGRDPFAPDSGLGMRARAALLESCTGLQYEVASATAELWPQFGHSPAYSETSMMYCDDALSYCALPPQLVVYGKPARYPYLALSTVPSVSVAQVAPLHGPVQAQVPPVTATKLVHAPLYEQSAAVEQASAAVGSARRVARVAAVIIGGRRDLRLDAGDGEPPIVSEVAARGRLEPRH